MSSTASLFHRPELFGLDQPVAPSVADGKWFTSNSKKSFSVENPANTQEIGKVTDMTVDETKKSIEAAADGFKSYKNTTHVQRSEMLSRWATLMEENKEDLVKMLTLENGKPLSHADMEVSASISYIKWYAGEAVRVFGDIAPSSLQMNNFIMSVKQPVGISGLITPWNFPSAMITRKGGAALAAGCSIVIMPATSTPYSCLGLVKLAQEAGFPNGVINVVTTSNVSDHGKELSTNPLIRKISFTGSTNVGKILMGQSSSTVKKVSMELGGNAPFIVFPDFPIDQAVDSLCNIKFFSAGEVCVCPNRVYLHKDIYEEFTKKLLEKVKTIKVGDGLDPSTGLGPLISKQGCDKMASHIEDSVSKGAKLLVGGKRITDKGGYFYEPTVLANLNHDMIVACEETFGPLISLFQFENVDQVLEQANDTEVGLAGYVFSKDVSTLVHVAKELEVGLVGANIELVDEPFMSFGGIKQSGFGKEAGRHGVEEFMIIKEVNLKTH